MNKTRYKIATLTGSAVMAAMLLSLLILNIVFNKKIELRAENAIKKRFYFGFRRIFELRI